MAWASAEHDLSSSGTRYSRSTQAQYPGTRRSDMNRMQRRELPDGWDAELPTFPADAKGIATRDASAKVLNAMAQEYPWLMGGSADLVPSTKTRLTFDGAGDFEAGHYSGRNLHFGIREHAMGAIVNGMALSKLRAYRLDLLHLQRLYEACRSGFQPSWRSHRSGSSPMIPSASARTARPTSRSNNWSRCARFPG